jgi:hypothetical protein
MALEKEGDIEGYPTKLYTMDRPSPRPSPIGRGPG